MNKLTKEHLQFIHGELNAHIRTHKGYRRTYEATGQDTLINRSNRKIQALEEVCVIIREVLADE